MVISERLIVVAATDEVQQVLDLTLPNIKAYAAKCNAELRILTGLPPIYQHGKFRIFEAGEIEADRLLLLDADIYIRESAPDIFETYPTGNWMLDEGAYRGHGFDAHRRELESHIGRSVKWHGDRQWWNPGVSLLSQDAARAIFVMPPYDVTKKLYNVQGGRVVKNMPWINYRISVTETEIKPLDIRYNTFPAAPDRVQREAYFWHCACGEATRHRNETKAQIIHNMCYKYGEKSMHQYHVHFVCGNMRPKWILERMQDHIIKEYAGRVKTSTNTEAVDAPGVINFYNPYRTFRKKSRHAKDVVFCTHPEVLSTWDNAIKEADHVVVMCEQYRDSIAQLKGDDNVTLIYPGVDEIYLYDRLRIFNPCRMDGGHRIRKGKALWDSIAALPYVHAICSGGKLSDKQIVDLYRGCDVVVSTATMEGGPMCVLEALALGKPVIAPYGVGLVNDFLGYPNIETYEPGNATELIDLLMLHYTRKQDKTQHMQEYTWRHYAQQHIALFDKIAERITPAAIARAPKRGRQIEIYTGAASKGKIQETIQFIREFGITATTADAANCDIDVSDIIDEPLLVRNRVIKKRIGELTKC